MYDQSSKTNFQNQNGSENGHQLGRARFFNITKIIPVYLGDYRPETVYNIVPIHHSMSIT